MAEESTDPLVTTENQELDSNSINDNIAGIVHSPTNGSITPASHLRASIGSYHVGDISTTNSTEKSHAAKSSPKKIPHYLRASTGSCHDFCKYGRKYAFEEKSRKPIRKRIGKPLQNEMIPVQIFVSGEQQKKKVVKQMPSSDSQNHSPDLKPSPDNKSYSRKPRTTSLNNGKVFKPKPSEDIKNHSSDLKPSPYTKSYSSNQETSLDKGKGVKLKDRSPGLESSPDTKSYSPKPETSLVKEEVVKHKPSTIVESRSPDLEPSPDIRYYSPKPQSSLVDEKVVEQNPKSDTKDNSSDLDPSPDTESSLPKHETSMENVVILSPSADTKDHSPTLEPSSYTNSCLPEPETSLDKEKVVKHKPPTDAKNRSLNLKPSPDTKSYSQNPKSFLDKGKLVKYNPATDIKDHSPVLAPSPDANSNLSKPKKSLASKTYSSRVNDSSGRKTHFLKYKPATAKKFPSPDPPEIVKRVLYPFKKVESPAKSGSSTGNKMSRTYKKANTMSKEHSPPVKSKSIKVKQSSSSENIDGIRGIRGKGRRKSDVATGRKMTAAKAFGKKVSTLPPTTLSPKLSLLRTASTKSRKAGISKLVPPLKNQNRRRRAETREPNNDEFSEKTLHGIKREESLNCVSESIPDEHTIPSLPSSSSPKSLSPAMSSSSSSYEELDAEADDSGCEGAEKLLSDNNKSTEIDKVEPVKEKVQPVQENQNKTQKKSRVVVSEDKHHSPAKLKFRSGKVVDSQSDNNRPWRLRFRRARVVGPEEDKADLRRRTLKKGGVNDETNGAELSSKKVSLKHQDVQDKKDAQGLFNNVIEETASKLVESRKSKVKALVGAFETVISLQESKPSRQAVS